MLIVLVLFHKVRGVAMCSIQHRIVAVPFCCIVLAKDKSDPQPKCGQNWSYLAFSKMHFS